MKQKKFSIIAMVITLFFQLSIIAPAIEIKAAEITNTFQFITGISLTDAKGELTDSLIQLVKIQRLNCIILLQFQMEYQ